MRSSALKRNVYRPARVERCEQLTERLCDAPDGWIQETGRLAFLGAAKLGEASQDRQPPGSPYRLLPIG